jgi:hypothetical protein
VKKKTGRGGRQGPKFGAPPEGGEISSSSGKRRDMSTVRCFANVERWVTMQDSVPRRRRSSMMY